MKEWKSWNKVKTGELRDRIGRKIFCFSPFNDLGLVICDEEHDSSFKQYDPAPRYNGRDAAIYFASVFHANVLLGSATPSLRATSNAMSGKYGFAELKQRYGDLQLPVIEFIDLRTIERKDKTKITLSPPLVDAIKQTTDKRGRSFYFRIAAGMRLTRFAMFVAGFHNANIVMCR